ncbi:uncharacterized protein AMSG_08658 [Thecamonas trahens ATCC 50062]|uniref:Uncharacterized protein n=1 Tax=Thecamonas trahens ATCC 50062 TaxID=461836 RepID=A0A0L0DK35_THETB|nr:hypothetical protein AMSG_08658 [Thecamonas trahens ATCC 50062]KNC52774.1 hypothetical protein AMSG_08658 [Thecamonas trahens ATCC 50062]|eukprot:XP_013755086.1 hypothetical protein AMSG_08658 [Thecamonas trahens ATCC 50062]
MAYLRSSVDVSGVFSVSPSGGTSATVTNQVLGGGPRQALTVPFVPPLSSSDEGAELATQNGVAAGVPAVWEGELVFPADLAVVFGGESLAARMLAAPAHLRKESDRTLMDRVAPRLKFVFVAADEVWNTTPNASHTEFSSVFELVSLCSSDGHGPETVFGQLLAFVAGNPEYRLVIFHRRLYLFAAEDRLFAGSVMCETSVKLVSPSEVAHSTQAHTPSTPSELPHPLLDCSTSLFPSGWDFDPIHKLQPEAAAPAVTPASPSRKRRRAPSASDALPRRKRFKKAQLKLLRNARSMLPSKTRYPGKPDLDDLVSRVASVGDECDRNDLTRLKLRVRKWFSNQLYRKSSRSTQS